jgi:hypothetical protein
VNLTQVYHVFQGANIGTPMVPEGNIHSKSVRIFPAEVLCVNNFSNQIVLTNYKPNPIGCPD